MDYQLNDTLDEIIGYFAGCALHAAQNSSAEEKFHRYIEALEEVQKELLMLEDDNK